MKIRRLKNKNICSREPEENYNLAHRRCVACRKSWIGGRIEREKLLPEFVLASSRTAITQEKKVNYLLTTGAGKDDGILVTHGPRTKFASTNHIT